MPHPRRTVMPSIAPHRLNWLRSRPWDEDEVRWGLDRLDHVGMKLLALFGTAECAVFDEDGWSVLIAGLTIPAQRLEDHYRIAAEGSELPPHACIRDAVLLAASTGPLTQFRVRRMAGKLAPAAMQAFDGAPQPEWVTFRHVEALVSAGLLRVVGLRGGAVAWELTDAGRRTVDETILPAWWRLAESPDGGASAV